jgi:cell division protein FtsQ
MRKRSIFAIGQSLKVRALVRCAAVLLLGTTVVHGFMRNGVLDYEGSPWPKIPGKISALVGLAAEDIRISGLTHHDPELLLQALNVKPGGSLLGFDAAQARITLEGMSWVSAASVQRKYPNTLEIAVTEREPFAIWQHAGTYNLIDKAGIVMGSLDLMAKSQMLLVTGEGANLGASQLVNQLEANPALLKKVRAAAMVGQRRWNLYLDNGVKIALPAEGVPEALNQVSALDASQNILSKAVREIDMRVAKQMTVAIAEIDVTKDSGAVGQKLSQK